MYDALLVVTAVGCGLAGGVFFAFSTFVMAGLGRLPAADGVRAMQSVNVTAVTPVFMGLFLGTAVLCVVAGGWALPHGDGLVVAAAVAYLGGCLATTAAVNVPLNNRLASLDPEAADAPAVWDAYRTRWVRWNHVRTLGGALACGLLAVTLLQR